MKATFRIHIFLVLEPLKNWKKQMKLKIALIKIVPSLVPQWQ